MKEFEKWWIKIKAKDYAGIRCFNIVQNKIDEELEE